jgi:hypothetical protein
MRTFRIGMVVLLAATLAACANKASNSFEPTPEEMRGALLTLIKERPDLSIPEFENSLKYQKPEYRDGNVYIGSWICDPKMQTFLALFSGGSTSMYEVSGRFEQTPSGTWVAIARRTKMVRGKDVSGYWRASDMDSHWDSN